MVQMSDIVTCTRQQIQDLRDAHKNNLELINSEDGKRCIVDPMESHLQAKNSSDIEPKVLV